jgi:DMSO/TMAO reductase YedYZ molybdopterin-dependent catalytic subunit
MQKLKIANGAFTGGLTSIALIGLFYFGQQLFGFPLVPFDIFDWFARILPGDVVTLGIDAMVNIIDALNLGSTSETAKLIEQLLAASIFIVAGGILGGIVGLISFRTERKARPIGLITGGLVFFLILFMELNLGTTEISLMAIIWMAALFEGWGLVVGAVVDSADREELLEDEKASRRTILLRLTAGTLGVAAGAWGLGRLISVPDEEIGASQPLVQATATSAPQVTIETKVTSVHTATVTTRDRVLAAPGTRDELTSNEDFYRIDINTFRPVLKEDEWKLEVAGLFDNGLSLTLSDLMSYPAVTQPITLSCISNRVGGDLIGTSNWTGIPLRDLLEEIGLQPQAQELLVEAADGFYESVTMRDMMDPRTLLVYGMNDKTLPVDHGFPLRIYIPNRYGMKQPKWITKITAIDEEGSGYWTDRGWSKTAHPQIVSVIDTIADKEPTSDGRIPIGGIAWAGDRGIKKVELKFGNGEWLPATLRLPTLSPLTWVQWRYDWDADPGSHQVHVRATDGLGAIQIEEESGVRPDGATGYHSKSVRI